MIHCSNPDCLTPNPVENRDCLQCGEPLIKRYLRVLGNGIQLYHTGEAIEERYLVVAPRIVLDLCPELATTSPLDMPDSALPYLKLFPYHLHLPQLHSYLASPDSEINLEMWFLEYNSVPLDGGGNPCYPESLFPPIAERWPTAAARQQLQWLCQLAKLWEPLKSQGVVSSLLQPDLIGINEPFVQLLELCYDEAPAPTLAQLGSFWSTWVESANPSIADFLQRTCLDLQEEKLVESAALKILLEAGLQELTRPYHPCYSLFTATDKGPQREHNEDSCYPPGDTAIEVSGSASLLAMVCDGIGGQDAGEIASQLAVECLTSEISTLTFPDSSQPDTQRNTVKFLQKAILKANEHIFQRNEGEGRHERKRMGTTLVLSLFQGANAYLAHAGDSRIYWITPSHCHPVTVDDDWASKEVRLGYVLYRDALQYPKSGALVQALGISESAILSPTVQHWIPDENCLILLCSDGLSDCDRVEQYWRSLLAPVLRGEVDVATAGRKLVELANRQNGHDNVSIALIHCRLAWQVGMEVPTLHYEALYEALNLSLPTDFYHKPTALTATSSHSLPSPPVSVPFFGRWVWIASLTALGLVGTVAAFSLLPFTPRSPKVPVREEAIAPGKFLALQQELPLYTENPENRPDLTAQTLLPGSVLQIQLAAGDSPWVVVTICPTAAGANSALANRLGWIPRDRIDPARIQSTNYTACQEPPP